MSDVVIALASSPSKFFGAVLVLVLAYVVINRVSSYNWLQRLEKELLIVEKIKAMELEDDKINKSCSVLIDDIATTILLAVKRRAIIRMFPKNFVASSICMLLIAYNLATEFIKLDNVINFFGYLADNFNVMLIAISISFFIDVLMLLLPFVCELIRNRSSSD